MPRRPDYSPHRAWLALLLAVGRRGLRLVDGSTDRNEPWCPGAARDEPPGPALFKLYDRVGRLGVGS